MSRARNKQRDDDWQLTDGECLDRSFDTDGVLYSGFVPKPKPQHQSREEPTQKPLTELEQRIRERWHARRDPITLLRGHFFI
jgi:hypothetical protein